MLQRLQQKGIFLLVSLTICALTGSESKSRGLERGS